MLRRTGDKECTQGGVTPAHRRLVVGSQSAVMGLECVGLH